MKPLCEHVVGEVLPGVRAIIAKKLMDDHGLSQTQVAGLLDTTQPAVSQYKREMRGRKFSSLKGNPGLLEVIESLTKRIVSGEITPKQTDMEFCEVCKYMQNSGLLEGFCPQAVSK